jgi:hypothetical protein
VTAVAVDAEQLDATSFAACHGSDSASESQSDGSGHTGTFVSSIDLDEHGDRPAMSH